MPPEPRPKVSVLITTYNQADTLPTALDSILAQKTDFEIEICLSDDCSTDSTPTVCERYAARYPEIIKYHRNSHNLGARDNYFTTMMRCRIPTGDTSTPTPAWHIPRATRMIRHRSEPVCRDST